LQIANSAINKLRTAQLSDNVSGFETEKVHADEFECGTKVESSMAVTGITLLSRWDRR
jgi:hypothetical protein